MSNFDQEDAGGCAKENKTSTEVDKSQVETNHRKRAASLCMEYLPGKVAQLKTTTH
jgi:hypothetical protein